MADEGMSAEQQTRHKWLVSFYPDLFNKDREEKLPVWARIKLNRIRDLLESEARENDALRAEIERLSHKP